MGRGTVTKINRTGGFVGIGENSKEVAKALHKVMKRIEDPKFQRKVHANTARTVRDVMRGNIKDADETFRIRRSGKRPMSPKSKRGPRMDIPPGTLKRSVWAWRIPKTNDYWAGPRVSWMLGKTLPVDRDGWFANIVEGDDQMFGPGTPNAGVFERSARQAAPMATRFMLDEYSKRIDQAAKETRRT